VFALRHHGGETKVSPKQNDRCAPLMQCEKRGLEMYWIFAGLTALWGVASWTKAERTVWSTQYILMQQLKKC